MQHYDKRGQYGVALGKIDEAIAHTPTVIDLYSVKVFLLIMAKYIMVYVTVVAWTMYGDAFSKSYW